MLNNLIKKYKKKKLYLKLYLNSIEITDLSTQKKIISHSNIPFDNERLLIAHFNKALHFYKKTLEKNDLINSNTTVLIHQKAKKEDGLSEVEKRVLEDLFSIIGIKNIYITDIDKDLNNSEIENYLV